jgi:hypothetical protein
MRIMTDPVVRTGKITIEGGAPLRCPTCGADDDHVVSGEIGGPARITCWAGHELPLPDDVNPVDFMMFLASQPGVEVVLPEDW